MHKKSILVSICLVPFFIIPFTFSCRSQNFFSIISSRMNKSAKDLPAFFKVHIPEHSSERMEIPQAAVEPMGLKESTLVSLIGPSGERWRVDVVREGKDLFFDDGWKVFVKDHLLLIGEFLVFRFNGDSSLKVQILDHSACEKESAFTAKCSQRTAEPKKEQKEEAGNNRNRLQGLVESRKHLSAKNASALEFVKLGSGRSSNIAESDENHGHLIGSLKQLHLMEMDHVLPSGHPHFDLRMRDYNVCNSNILHIPATFVRKQGLAYSKNEKMILRNRKGAWPVNVIPLQKSYDFCGGWSSFVRENNVKEGYICRFELVARLEMIVHIFSLS